MVNGKIVAIGDNVRVWLSEGDTVPEHTSASQIQYYSGSNTQADNGERFSDIFVIHEGSSYSKNGSTYALNKVQGNLDGQYKDYVFLQGHGEEYGFDATLPSSGKTNALTSFKVFDADSQLTIGTCNHLEGIIYGDGLSSIPGETTATWDITLKIAVNLDSTDGSQMLARLTLHGIPEGAIFDNTGLESVSYDAATGNYILILLPGVISYSGLVTINDIPDGEQNMEMSLQVETSEGLYDFDDIHSASDFSETIDYDYTREPDSFSAQDEGEALDDAAAMIASGYIDTDQSEESVDEDHNLQATQDTDNQHDETSLAAADNETAADGHDTDSADNHPQNSLIDDQPFALDGDHDEPHLSTTVSPDAAETEENSLNTLLGDADNTSLYESETVDTESSLNNSAHASEPESSIISHDEPLSFSDIISDTDTKDLSTLIQTEEAATADTLSNVEPVPAEGGGEEGQNAWVNDDNQVEDLIAKPEVES